jgi:hypothetical protein
MISFKIGKICFLSSTPFDGGAWRCSCGLEKYVSQQRTLYARTTMSMVWNTLAVEGAFALYLWLAVVHLASHICQSTKALLTSKEVGIWQTPIFTLWSTMLPSPRWHSFVTRLGKFVKTCYLDISIVHLFFSISRWIYSIQRQLLSVNVVNVNSKHCPYLIGFCMLSLA